MDNNPGLMIINTIVTQSGPGNAQLAASWASSHNLEKVEVWADTADYMYNNFTSQLGGSYPNTMIINLETMELEHFAVGGVQDALMTVQEILDDADDCATF